MIHWLYAKQNRTIGQGLVSTLPAQITSSPQPPPGMVTQSQDQPSSRNRYLLSSNQSRNRIRWNPAWSFHQGHAAGLPIIPKSTTAGHGQDRAVQGEGNNALQTHHLRPDPTPVCALVCPVLRHSQSDPRPVYGPTAGVISTGGKAESDEGSQEALPQAGIVAAAETATDLTLHPTHARLPVRLGSVHQAGMDGLTPPPFRMFKKVWVGIGSAEHRHCQKAEKG